MTQKTSPFLEGKYGWEYGENGWNTGMDDNLLKFSFMFDRNVDGIVSSLPTAVAGQAWFLTVDNRLYFAVGSTFYSSPTPKWFQFTLKSTGAMYQYDGDFLNLINNPSQIDTRLDAVEVTLSDLGTAAFEDVGFFATQADLDVASSTAQSYTDDLRADLALSSQGASLIGYTPPVLPTFTTNLNIYIDKLPKYTSAYGLGSGVSDDKATLQSLIDTLSAAGGGEIIFDSNSDYLVSDSIYVRSNITLRFIGSGFIKATTSTSNGAVLVVYSGSPSTITDNVVIYNPRVDGNNLGYPTSAVAGENGVAGTKCSHVRVYGGLIKNCKRGTSSQTGAGGKGLQFESGVEDILVDGVTIKNCTVAMETGGVPDDATSRKGIAVTYTNIKAYNCERLIVLNHQFTAPFTTAAVNAVVDGVQAYNCGKEIPAGTEYDFGLIVWDRYGNSVIRNIEIYNEDSYGKINSLFRGRRGTKNTIENIKFWGECDYIINHTTTLSSVGTMTDNVFGPIYHYGTCNNYAVNGPAGESVASAENSYIISTDIVTLGLVAPTWQYSGLYGNFTAGDKITTLKGPLNVVGGMFANTYPATPSSDWLRGSATYDPASLVDGSGVTTTVTVTGAVVGDLVIASFSNDLQGIVLTAYVSAANTVSVRFQNETTATIDLASGTLRVRVMRL